MSFVRPILRYVPRSGTLKNMSLLPSFNVGSKGLRQNWQAANYISSSYKTCKTKVLKQNSIGSIRKGWSGNYTSTTYEATDAGGGGDSDISKRISGLVSASDVVVFMKGVPTAPRCGFSNAVCQIFRMHNVNIESHDVLADEELRQGIKEYSNWPTIPQVFFKGEFIGGCDILLQMHQSGELIEELEKIGIKSALLTAEESKKADDK